MKKILFKSLIILLIFSCINNASDNIQDDIIQFIREDVSRYFVKQYIVHPEDIDVNFKRLPAELDETSKFNFKISNSAKDYKPGYQTVWIEVYKSNIFKIKFPISFDISIQKEVAVSKNKIKRGQHLSSELVEIKKMEINTNPEYLFTSVEELSEFESAKYIKSGTILTMRMVRIPPALKKGDNVEIRLSSGNLFISTQGIVKEDGHLGDMVRVICQNSRKKLTGVVQSSDLVLVTNSGY